MNKRPEVIHDEKLLELLTAVWNATIARNAKGDHIIAIAADKPGSNIVRRSADWEIRRTTYRVGDVEGREATALDAIGYLERLATPGDVEGVNSYDRTYGGSTPERAQERLSAWNASVEAVRAAYEAITTHEQDYTGWSRFYLVTSSAGHVHSSVGCSTCNHRTTFAPVPSLSGLGEDAAVAELGETLCTVCFPSAPVKPAKITQAQAVSLIEGGEEAFLAMRAKAKPACAGSGTRNFTERPGGRRYVTCNTCGDGVPTTNAGVLRKHSASKGSK